eukprot:TRINITY_DN76898_c0_g1_i1.p1 TRINITY_DN76898_c0_g1~~TRINITY_DN76898_c0_g1_i1.p1  ORF type:complete len:292 (+),score=21.78 TRINITY_DN76898_c0_g1_i1:74-949(+)
MWLPRYMLHQSVLVAAFSTACVQAADIDGTAWCLKTPLAKSPHDFNAESSWFSRPGEAAEKGPWLIVLDDFYPQKEFEHVRKLADNSQYTKYWPSDGPWQWNSSTLYVRAGELLPEAFESARYAPDHLRLRLEQTLGESIEQDTWLGIEKLTDGRTNPIVGDGWNGAFHIFNDRWVGGAIHHHWKSPDVEPRGWSGVLFLRADEESTCTTFWRERQSGLCVATEKKTDFEFFPDRRFDLAAVAHAKPNRLVLFREALYHRAEMGAASPYRATQTFFFLSRPIAAGAPRSDL